MVPRSKWPPWTQGDGEQSAAASRGPSRKCDTPRQPFGIKVLNGCHGCATAGRGFEKFAQGRRAEDMPQITSRICGVCPMAHHMAATKALDDLYQVDPPPAGRKIRELLYSAFMVEDHALHFFFLGGPDFIVGPDAPRQKRNILGVVDAVGLEVGKEVIGVRKQLRDLVAAVAGKAVHPVFGLPGGVSRSLSGELRQEAAAAAARAVEFGQFALGAFRKTVLGNPGYVELITSEAYTHRTYYMGLVDGANKVTFYDGTLRVVGPEGKELLTFTGRDYLDHVAEHVEPWTYMKFCFLKDVGWNGFTDGADSGVYSVAPLARLNVADGMATPRAQEAYEEFVTTLGPKPVHHTLANHWARIIELVYAAERMAELASDPEITDPQVRALPTAVPREGVGVVEAPRGTLFHHYQTDERGLVTAANLIVGTQNNAARIALSVDKAARADQERPGRRQAAEPGRDGVPRLRPVLRLRHAQPAWPHAADRRGQGRWRRAPA
jgi:F420-non-reducing hydrogenase large subunit